MPSPDWTAKFRARWPSLQSPRASNLAASGQLADLFVFLSSLALLWFVVPFGDLDGMIGDNVAQVAYWRILFHQDFVGSLGTSSMKPGLILLLGGAHDLSLALFQSTALLKLVFALAGAGLAVIVARIAKQGSGTIAGFGAALYLLTKTPVMGMFVEGTSMIVFFPFLLWGVWLFSRGRDAAGAVVLCLAALIRIEAFGVLLWLALAEQLFKQRWRRFMFSSAAVAITIALTVAVYYRAQGSVARFGAGGPSVGYTYSLEPSAARRLLTSLEYGASFSYEMLFEQCGFPYLAISAVLGLAFSKWRRFYVSVFAIPLVMMLFATSGEGGNELRFYHFLAPLIAAFGASGIVVAFDLGGRFRARLPSLLWLLLALGGVTCFVLRAAVPVCSLSLTLIAAALGALFRQWRSVVPPLLWKSAWGLLFAAVLLRAVALGDWPPTSVIMQYTLDAKDLLKGKRVPKGQRVLTEDDVIYGVLVRDLRLFRRVDALQAFVVQDDTRRAELLDSTDYIAVSKRNYPTYLLKNDPFKRSRSDPFRSAILLARQGRPTNLYGHTLVPIEVSRDWIVIKVELQRDAS